MEIATRQGPAFGVARIGLGAGEAVRVEAGAMMAMSAGVSLDSKMESGLFKSMKRATLGGESFFVTTFTAPEQGGFIDVAARLPGDVISYDVQPDHAFFIQKGSWLAAASSVTIDAKWGGFKNMFGSEGGFIIRAGGNGPVVFGCYGALETWNLAEGQTITVDTGHMVAYEDTVNLTLRKVTGGIVQMFKSGEGIVFDFTGPGKVMTQTRNPNELLGWISAAVGTGNSSPAGGLVGLLNRD